MVVKTAGREQSSFTLVFGWIDAFDIPFLSRNNQLLFYCFLGFIYLFIYLISHLSP